MLLTIVIVAKRVHREHVTKHQIRNWWKASTYKLKFGHRGANHPVRDEATGRVYVTSQNHGYAVDAGGLDPAVEVSQVHLNDGTVEGMTHRELPLFTIQYHAEASPGPHDTEFLFDRFLATLRGATVRGEARP